MHAHDAGTRSSRSRSCSCNSSRLDLLHRITRAIGERQDLRSIFQVVIRSLEDDLPIDFGCICLYDAAERHADGRPASARAASAVATSWRCTSTSASPSTATACRAACKASWSTSRTSRVSACLYAAARARGLRALVIAPLLAQGTVFGVLIAARKEAEASPATSVSSCAS